MAAGLLSQGFRSQGYFVNIPEFIQPDGKTMWLCYSANFTNDWLHTHYPIDPLAAAMVCVCRRSGYILDAAVKTKL